MTEQERKDEFRKSFRKSLGKCAVKSFSVEECFGIIWEETLERCHLPESEHGKLYEELIAWAKSLTAKP